MLRVKSLRCTWALGFFKALQAIAICSQDWVLLSRRVSIGELQRSQLSPHHL